MVQSYPGAITSIQLNGDEDFINAMRRGDLRLNGQTVNLTELGLRQVERKAYVQLREKLSQVETELLKEAIRMYRENSIPFTSDNQKKLRQFLTYYPSLLEMSSEGQISYIHLLAAARKILKTDQFNKDSAHLESFIAAQASVLADFLSNFFMTGTDRAIFDSQVFGEILEQLEAVSQTLFEIAVNAVQTKTESSAMLPGRKSNSQL